MRRQGRRAAFAAVGTVAATVGAASLGVAILGATSLPLAPAHAQATTPSAPAAKPVPLDLLEFRVEGNTLLTQREIEAAVYPFLGPGRSTADVEAAREALEQLYAKRGFPTVAAAIPPQSGAGGVVVLMVTERPIGRLRVVGARYVAPSAIRAAVPALAAGQVPQMNDVQQQLAILNQLPDRTVTPTLRAGRDPDTVDVDMKVDDALPLHGSLELNNRSTPQTTALRLSGSLSYDNLWQRGDSASLGFQVAPSRLDDAALGSAGYVYRIPGSRASLSASFVATNSNISSGAAGNVVGKGTITGLRLLLPFGGSETFSHSLSVGADYKDLTQQVGPEGQFTTTPTSYVPFSASYLASWTGARSTTDASATLVWAFGGFGNLARVQQTNAPQADNSRLYAQGDFAYLKADFSHTHTLPYGIEIYAHALAQVAPQPLISSEQLSLGGIDSVRGYLESESLGDYGGAGQLELRTPPLARLVGAPLDKLQLHAFVDAGADKIHQPFNGQRASDTLASTGVGASVRLLGHLGGEIDDAQVLLPGPFTKSGSNRVLFRVYGDF